MFWLIYRGFGVYFMEKRNNIYLYKKDNDNKVWILKQKVNS